MTGHTPAPPDRRAPLPVQSRAGREARAIARESIGDDGAAEAVARCRFCGGACAFALRAGDRLRPESPERFDYFECRDCGSLQLARASIDLASAYPPDYYTHTQSGAFADAPGRRRGPGAVLRAGTRGVRRLRARLLLALPVGSLVARGLSGRRYGRFDWFRRTGVALGDPILDVGCGSGRLLFHMHREGFRALVGIDPGLPVALARLGAAAGSPRFARETAEHHVGEYALVMAHHSFEHAPDPRATFEALAARIRPGGWLLLRVPRADSWARRHYGADWAQLDAPRHLHVPTGRAIAGLARDYGLVLEHVEDDSGVFQIWGSERALPRAPLTRFWRWLVARRTAARLRRAGQGDQAAYSLRKPR